MSEQQKQKSKKEGRAADKRKRYLSTVRREANKKRQLARRVKRFPADTGAAEMLAKIKGGYRRRQI